jgi:hypothetical protein
LDIHSFLPLTREICHATPQRRNVQNDWPPRREDFLAAKAQSHKDFLRFWIPLFSSFIAFLVSLFFAFSFFVLF